MANLSISEEEEEEEEGKGPNRETRKKMPERNISVMLIHHH